MIFKSKISVECMDEDGVVRTHVLAGIDDEELDKLLIEHYREVPHEFILQDEGKVILMEVSPDTNNARRKIRDGYTVGIGNYIGQDPNEILGGRNQNEKA